jgi:hypothetical protein
VAAPQGRSPDAAGVPALRVLASQIERHDAATGVAGAKPSYRRLVTKCRLILHHADGRVGETSVWGDGPIGMGGYLRLPDHADHWWKVIALRWGATPEQGVAELEPTNLPLHLEKLEADES